MCRNYTTLSARTLAAFAVQRPRKSIATAHKQIQESKVMGELLEIASWVGTPLGGIVAVAFVAAMFFYGRWVLSDTKKKEPK
jgi:hypothetical protein